jgi:hypothetical protein
LRHLVGSARFQQGDSVSVRGCGWARKGFPGVAGPYGHGNDPRSRQREDQPDDVARATIEGMRRDRYEIRVGKTALL